jgi:hypothetical protein
MDMHGIKVKSMLTSIIVHDMGMHGIKVKSMLTSLI